jgi:CheY-like chemotaxis protein
MCNTNCLQGHALPRQNIAAMLINHCPACWNVNADEARNCFVCGADLGTADTVRLPLEPQSGRSSPSALWLDDLVGPRVGSGLMGPPDAAPITLRDVDALVPPPFRPAPSLPPALELVQSDPDVQAPMLPEQTDPAHATESDTGAAPALAERLEPEPATHHSPAQNQAGSAAPPASSAALIAAQRAERRAQVRRGRRRGQPAGGGNSSGATEVLIVGAATTSRDDLHGMLEGFGFTVHATADTAEALTRSRSPALLASFVSAEFKTLGGGTGIDLCGQLRQADVRPADSAALLVLVATKLKPSDRVRAELAGCDDAIPSPITRGSVARLLDSRGIAMPADPRRE